MLNNSKISFNIGEIILPIINLDLFTKCYAEYYIYKYTDIYMYTNIQDKNNTTLWYTYHYVFVKIKFKWWLDK